MYKVTVGYVRATIGAVECIKLLAPELFFLILAHIVYKM